MQHRSGGWSRGWRQGDEVAGCEEKSRCKKMRVSHEGSRPAMGGSYRGPQDVRRTGPLGEHPRQGWSNAEARTDWTSPGNRLPWVKLGTAQVSDMLPLAFLVWALTSRCTAQTTTTGTQQNRFPLAGPPASQGGPPGGRGPSL